AGMFEFARVLGLESWICELGGIRIYDRGDTVVHEHGAFPGGGVPTAELHRAVELLLEAYPGRLEEHSPWNATREFSFLLRGDAAADLECRNEVGRCFLTRNGLDKDPALAWVLEPGSGVEVTKAGHGEGFAEVVHRLLDG